MIKKKNLLTILISTFFSILFFYILFFISVYLENHHKAPYMFNSLEELNFHKLYSKKVHHLRDNDGTWPTNEDPKNFLFSTINQFSIDKPNILIQGDSWAEQINIVKESHSLLKNFVNEKNFGLINAGITSFSVSPMQVQYEVLEKNFNIKPNILIAYIDQTDLGDELCRYKDQRIYNNKNNLISIKNEEYSRAAYDYTKLYNISEAKLLHNSKFIRAFKITNFFIKYTFLRANKKIKSIKKYGWKNHDISKCRFDQIRRYLINSNESEIAYFRNRVKEYINFLSKKEYLDKIIFVTFPHNDHIFGYNSLENNKTYYTVNVSNIIENLVKNNKNIYHLNFSKLIANGKISLSKSMFKENDPGSHLRDKYHANIFVNGIINLLK